MARAWIGRHSEMALQDEPLSSCICAHRLWHRPLSGSHLHCQPRARLDSLAPVLDCLLRRSLYLRGRKLCHWIPAAVGGFKCGTDVRALACLPLTPPVAYLFLVRSNPTTYDWPLHSHRYIGRTQDCHRPVGVRQAARATPHVLPRHLSVL